MTNPNNMINADYKQLVVGILTGVFANVENAPQ